MENFCTFYIVRHGLTDWNVLNKVQGHTDIPLNEKGKSQAEELAQSLKNIPFFAAYSSDLSRAFETASYIAAQHHLPIHKTPILRERCYGAFEGRTWSDFAAWKEAGHLEKDQTFEKDELLKSRVESFFCSSSHRHPNQNILIVTHGGILKFLLSLWLKDCGDILISNTGYAVVQMNADQVIVKEGKGITITPHMAEAVKS